MHKFFPFKNLEIVKQADSAKNLRWHEFCKYNSSNKHNGNIMLGWTLLFLIIALVAGVLGFSGIAGAAVGIAKILFFIFLVLFLVSLIVRLAAK